MAYQGSLVHTLLKRHYEPFFETRIDAETGEATCFSRIDGKSYSEHGAVAELARLHQQPLEEMWRQRSRHFARVAAPEQVAENQSTLPERYAWATNHRVSAQPTQERKTQHQDNPLPDRYRWAETSRVHEITASFSERTASGSRIKLSRQEKEELNRDHVQQFEHAQDPNDLTRIAEEIKQFYRQGYSDESIAKNIFPTTRAELQKAAEEGRVRPFSIITDKSEVATVTAHDFLKYSTQDYQAFKPEKDRFHAEEKPERSGHWVPVVTTGQHESRAEHWFQTNRHDYQNPHLEMER